MGELKKIYVANGPGDAHVLRGLLQVEGIQVVIRGDGMVPFQGGSMFHGETRPSVWVLANDAARYARAVEIADAYAAGRPAPEDGEGSSWRCGSCGESIEPQFTACWSCGSERGPR